MRKIYKNIYSISSRRSFVIIHSKGKKTHCGFGRAIFLSKLENDLKEARLDDIGTLSSNNSINNQINIAVKVYKKNIKLAVKRNLLKRRFLHAIRECHKDLKKGYYIFNINKLCTFSELKFELMNYLQSQL